MRTTLSRSGLIVEKVLCEGLDLTPQLSAAMEGDAVSGRVGVQARLDGDTSGRSRDQT